MRAITYIINDPVNVSDIVTLILDYITLGNSVSEDTLFEIKVILNELIVNALQHGNKSNHNKHTYVTFKLIDDDYLYVSVMDEGSGFNYSKFSLVKDLDCTNSLYCDHGRGLVIVRQLCDKIKFNKCGNKVSIIKNLHLQQPKNI
ncbi:ATP-binding protein [Ruminiclostridium cellulolyticum]|uniref:Putative anti-sigma regulatory factor, serine/threonine protein kinase n=1 Tax=Ruminiclostridium cellulolyticum (strain ATCC 35319 / DSM 5812 / JCM 6584 / H10) TaxID=394503 RepID=B8I5W9_RUMCH|nr:ATP-binding protein [Ruminiclostridium cellulolyticum]ACL74786.1 putative anti-sigma regulatory factor, serine/threonine protein kinase [Ruminiclostridium cellulolyticum H10]